MKLKLESAKENHKKIQYLAHENSCENKINVHWLPLGYQGHPYWHPLKEIWGVFLNFSFEIAFFICLFGYMSKC